MPFEPQQNLQPIQQPQEVQPSIIVPAKKKSIFNNKKFLIFLGCVICIISVVTALLVVQSMNKPEPLPPQPVTLTFWGKSVEESVMNPLIKDFESKNPLIKVKYQKESEINYKERISERLQRKNAPALPDLVEVEESWIEDYQQQNYLSSVNDPIISSRYAKASIDNNSFDVPVKIKEQTVLQKRAFGVPYKFDTLAIAFNKKFLPEIKLTETEFNRLNWSGIIERSQILTKKTKVKEKDRAEYEYISRAGIAIGSKKNITNADKILQLLLLQNGSSIYDNVNFTFKFDENSQFILDFYPKFVLEEAWDERLGKDIDSFVNESVAMILVRTNDIDTIKARNPKLDFFTAMPGKISEVRNISLSSSLAMPSVKSANYTQTVEFLKYLTQPEVAIKLYTGKNRNTFIPAQAEALRQIPKDTHYAIFSDINPTAERFRMVNYDTSTRIISNYLDEVYLTAYNKKDKGQKIDRLVLDKIELESELNESLKGVEPTN